MVSCVLACQSGCDVRHVALVSQPALMSATLDLLHHEVTCFLYYMLLLLLLLPCVGFCPNGWFL